MSLFPDLYAAAARLRRDRLSADIFDGRAFHDDYLIEQINAAEADAQRALRVFFTPTEVLPETTTAAEREALDAAGTPWVEEPGYDLEGDFFSGERWGYLITRHKPIIDVHSMRFVYPQPYSGVFTIPLDWVRLDKKYGHVRLVPGTQSFAAPLSAGILQIMGAGRTIPQMIQLRYTAGLTTAAAAFPDLVDLVIRMAVLRLLQGLFLPASESISADGLSQSRSVDLDKYQAGIDVLLERLRQAIHGASVMVF